MAPFESLSTVSYSHSIATTALFCIISKIFAENRDFFISSAFDAPVIGGTVIVGVLPYRLVWKKLEWCGYPTVKNNVDDMFCRCDIIQACDGRTDGRTSCDSIVCAIHSTASVAETVVPRRNRKMADRAFSTAAPRAWNQLPTELNRTQSTSAPKTENVSFQPYRLNRITRA